MMNMKNFWAAFLHSNPVAYFGWQPFHCRCILMGDLRTFRLACINIPWRLKSHFFLVDSRLDDNCRYFVINTKPVLRSWCKQGKSQFSLKFKSKVRFSGVVELLRSFYGQCTFTMSNHEATTKKHISDSSMAQIWSNNRCPCWSIFMGVHCIFHMSFRNISQCSKGCPVEVHNLFDCTIKKMFYESLPGGDWPTKKHHKTSLWKLAVPPGVRAHLQVNLGLFGCVCCPFPQKTTLVASKKPGAGDVSPSRTNPVAMNPPHHNDLRRHETGHWKMIGPWSWWKLYSVLENPFRTGIREVLRTGNYD